MLTTGTHGTHLGHVTLLLCIFAGGHRITGSDSSLILVEVLHNAVSMLTEELHQTFTGDAESTLSTRRCHEANADSIRSMIARNVRYGMVENRCSRSEPRFLYADGPKAAEVVSSPTSLYTSGQSCNNHMTGT
jgi:hypothetical protein